ncbi:MAG TPA: cell surface protein SprA [Puia sp.]|nr:cell surface protein SprA [Puia sp.]
MTRCFRFILATLLLGAALVVVSATAAANPFSDWPGKAGKRLRGGSEWWEWGGMCPMRDTIPADSARKLDSMRRLMDSATRLRFPLYDRRGDFLEDTNRNPFDLRDPPNIRDSVVYDPVTQQYYIMERVGSQYYRKPTFLTQDEMLRIQGQKDQDAYFRSRADALDALNRRMMRPNLTVSDNLFNRIFGTGKPDIRPQGNVDITAGYQGENIQNPTLPLSARRQGGFMFDESANLNVLGSIGSKLKLPISYNTLANFNFENQLKLDYTGSSDEIIKKIEAGNVSFQTRSTLITGAQSLFGIKTQLQFGKLTITGVLANETSQKQSISSAGGAQVSNFSFKADDYDENRHFLLGQYFVNNYNFAMSTLPIVSSQVQILRMEVWVTNRQGYDTSSRQIVGLMDLGEQSPYNPKVHSLTSVPYPFNTANTEYTSIVNDPASRDPTTAVGKLNSLGLTQVQDFEIVYARKLGPSEYSYDPQVGFISVNQMLQPSDVLAVAYQYSYNGKIYQVGEFASDVPPDTAAANPLTGVSGGASKVLYLKLLKATAQRTSLPIWNLMMKNIYTLKIAGGSALTNITKTGFQLSVNYDQPSKGTKNYLPQGPAVDTPLITILGLDRLNANNDPGPDGVFDYIEGHTVLSSQGVIIFPVLKPFGEYMLQRAFHGNAPDSFKAKYIYSQLYDTIKAVAQTYANVDRYVISGTAKGQMSNQLSLGAFNVPPGSVVVTAGGQTLKENQDYTVDYASGQVTIINQSIINSGVPVNVSFENNANFGLQQKSFMGLRLDYLAKNTATETFALGATIERLNERPFFAKTDYGEDPVRNTMFGVDANYRGQLPQLTMALNHLYPTKEMSTINAYGEAAILRPGHPPQIGRGNSGAVYVDDFEGSTSAIDLRFPLTSWAMASTPAGVGGTYPPLFPEAVLNNDLAYGYNRARLAWYNIDPTLQNAGGATDPDSYENTLLDPRIGPVLIQQIFPQQSVSTGQAQLQTFDMAFYPTDRGPYNFDTRPGSINTADGKLNNPGTRWGGIMRALQQTDFETANIEVLQFWVLNPFAKTSPTLPAGQANVGNTTGGQLYIDLGSVSEDILRDGKKEFENGLNTPNITAAVDSSSVWGRVPANPIEVTTAFSNNSGDRPYQDVGLDGMGDQSEQTHFSSFLNTLGALVGTTSPAYSAANSDPSSDNFINYLDPRYDAAKVGVLGRYKYVNNPQGNSPIAATGATTISAFTLYPDQEDLNNDNTMNTLEQYFEYKVNLTPDSFGITNGVNYITDSINFHPNGGVSQTWYQFSIPLAQYYQNVGHMPDMRSIQFMRMYLTGWQDSVVLRFAQLQLVRNTWRSFSYVVDTTGNMVPLPNNSSTSFNVTAVNIEQNSSRQPVNYVIPPGVERQQELNNNNVNLLLNEQSMSLQICNLSQFDSRGVYKTTNLDLRRYGTIDMFIHAESAGTPNTFNDGDLEAIVRMGSDFTSNYYEIRIPLKKTQWQATLPTDIWPAENNLDLNLQRLIRLKEDRNNTGVSNVYYKEADAATGRIYAIIGNPNLGAIQAFFLGVENVNQPYPVCTEVWFDELRLTDISEKGGWAVVGKVDTKLADLGTLSVAGSNRSAGWGTIDQNTSQRSYENDLELDAATNLELGKLLPRKAALSVPVYAGITRTVATPEYDPYDLDIKLKDKLAQAPSRQKDSIRKQAIDATTTETVNLTNLHKNNTTNKRLQLWSIENLNVSYSYTHTGHHSPLAVEDDMTNHKGSLAYNFSRQPRYKEPFKRLIKARTPWLGLIKDFNYNLMPTVLGVQFNIDRQFGAFRSRNVGGPENVLPETFNKFFTFDRLYTLKWDFTRSLSLSFNATNKSWIDEDPGRQNGRERKNMWTRFFRGGRNVLYNQNLNLTYLLPTSKIPALDWTKIQATYASTYTWTTASLLAPTFGNSIQNSQQRMVTADLDFTRLYDKWKLLKSLDAGPSRPTNGRPDTGRGRRPSTAPPAGPQLTGFPRAVARILTSLKRISINYSDNSASAIYGFLDSTQALGMDLRTQQPGWKYTLGMRPDTNFINRLGQKGLIATDTNFNQQNTISYIQKISITAMLEPIRDFHISVNLDKSFGMNYSELYKDTAGGSYYSRLNPYNTGTFTISFLSYKTLFEKYQPDQVTKTFLKFENNRMIISHRIGALNPYAGGLTGPNGYVKGYGLYSQDVLIPAFLAAYTGKDPQKIALMSESGGSITANPFSGYLPRPNWHITYTGLTKVPFFNKIFTSFNLSNSYTSSLSMGTFNSNLNYFDPLGYRVPGFVDTLTGNFVPFFQVPNITIQEQFAPLLGIDMTFVNQMQAKVSYSRSRQLSLSLIDYQLSETQSTELDLGWGIKYSNVGLPFGWKVPGNGRTPPNGAPGSINSRKAQNDLTLRVDISIRNDAMSSSYLDQNTALPTGGQKVIRIDPSINYVLNNRINLKFFFDQQRTTPAISTTPPIVTTKGGIQVRIALAP